MNRPVPVRIERAVAAIARVFAAAGGIVVLAMMLVSVADVALRYLFNAPLASAYELIQMAMVIVVYGGLAWCGLTGGHVALGVLDKHLDRPRLAWLKALVAAAGGALFLVIAWQSAREALRAHAGADATNMLKIPLAPLIAAVAAGSALYAAVLLLQAWRTWRRRTLAE